MFTKFGVQCIPRSVQRVLRNVLMIVVITALLLWGNSFWKELVEIREAGVRTIVRNSTVSDNYPQIISTQMARQKQVLQGCPEISQTEPLSAFQTYDLYQRIFVDHKHRFAYCSVPKAACTEWKQIILKTSGISEYKDKEISSIFPHYDYKFKRLSDLPSLLNAGRVMSNYYVFTFVRDPLARLISAWRDKFQHHSRENRTDYLNFHHRFGRRIMKKYRKGRYTAEELGRGFPITFEEYISYITSFSNPEDMDEHWRPISLLCRPCHIDLDFIGRFEDQKKESEYLTQYLKIQDFVPKGFFREASTASRDEALRLLKDLPLSQREILSNIYKDDALLFGYNLEEYLILKTPT